MTVCLISTPFALWYHRVFPCATPAEVRASLPANTDVVVFQCRNPIHRAHYELFTRSLSAPNVRTEAVVLVHPTVGPTQVSMGTWPPMFAVTRAYASLSWMYIHM